MKTIVQITISKYSKEHQKTVDTTIELKYPTQTEIDAVVNTALNDEHVVSVSYVNSKGKIIEKQGIFNFDM